MTTARSTVDFREQFNPPRADTGLSCRLALRCVQVATLLLAISLWGAAQAQDQRVSGGSVMAYYFDSAGKLIAGEMVLDPRPIKQSNQPGVDLLTANACSNMPAPPGAGMQVGNGVSATAVYVRVVGNPGRAAEVLAVEDMTGVTDRQIRAMQPIPAGGPVCHCSLVWCGPVKCCPCP